MASCRWRLLCAAACLAATPAVSYARESIAPPKRVALAVYEKGVVDRALLDAFLFALEEIERRSDSITIVSGPDEQGPERTRPNPLMTCGADLRCISRAGSKAGATHVLLCRATAQSDGIDMQWILVDAATARLAGKLSVTLADPEKVPEAAAQVASELLGVPRSESVSQPTSADHGAALQPSQPAPRTWIPTRVAGGAAIALGVLSAGAGAYFALRARSSNDPAYDSSTRADVQQRNDIARAGVLFTAGGLLVAGGTAIWVRQGPVIAPIFSAGRGGRMAGLSVTW